jgi:hypothetical protein
MGTLVRTVISGNLLSTMMIGSKESERGAVVFVQKNVELPRILQAN